MFFYLKNTESNFKTSLKLKKIQVKSLFKNQFGFMFKMAAFLRWTEQSNHVPQSKSKERLSLMSL